MGQKIKNKSVNGDGVFKVGEKVNYRNPDFHIDGIKYLKAKILNIFLNKENGRTYYDYKLNIPNFHDSILLVKKNSFKKYSENLEIDYSKFKYKIGDNVYIDHWVNPHTKGVIKSISINKNNDVLYHVIIDDNIRSSQILREDCLYSRKTNLTQSKFKIGDRVAYEKLWSQIKETSIIEEIFYYDNELNRILCRLKGNYNMVFHEDNLIKVRDPVIIFSEMDPFGEEDWGEDEEF